MNLSISSVTLRETTGKDATFPAQPRERLCEAVEIITVNELGNLLSKHETDTGNFDGRIADNLRRLAPSYTIESNRRISSVTRFDTDLVIHADGTVICVEIEKGYLARFEFDILKMQAFASQRKSEGSQAPVFGAFIVPTDNVVARHISGGSKESSFRYLQRISRLIAQIRPLLIEDLLIIGYGIVKTQQETDMPTRREEGTQRQLDWVDGLIPDKDLAILQGYPTELLHRLRRRLAAACPKLREKFNPGSRYLGYANGPSRDALYIYVQKKALVMDMRLPADMTEDLRARGFDVRPRDNFQGRQGWLTGLHVPHDSDREKEVVALMVEALQGEQTDP